MPVHEVFTNMPMQSEAQRRAMFAAKGGKSTLGIPQSVGEDFAEHDQGGKLPKYASEASRDTRRKAMVGTKPKSPAKMKVI